MKVRTARLTPVVLGLLCLGTTVGCSSQSPLDSEDAATGSGTIDAVGLMVQDVSNPFFAAMKHSVEELGKEKGFTVNTQDGQQDLGQQNAQMDAFIQQGVDVVLISAVDTDGIGPVVQRAVDAGIVVVALDVDAANAQAVVMADNTEAGAMACSALADKIGGSGNIMIVDGTQVSSVQDRVQGCLEVLRSDYPDVTIVAQQAGKNDVGSGQQIATDMLTAHKDVQGIFGINDPTARGAVLALEQAGRDDVWVVGVDGSPEGATAMKSGGSFWASATQDPGQQAVTAFGLAEKIAAGDPPADRVTRLAPTLVTQDDVADYTGWVVE